MYEEGKLVRATEADITLSGEIVISKDIVNTIRYYYDSEGNLARKVIAPAGAVSQTVFYETSEETNTVVKFQLPVAENTAIKPCVTAHSKNDSFGRKEFDELQLGKTFLYRRFDYHAGALTTAHTEKDKVKSTPTTQLVSKISFSDGRTIEYEYDKEERITKVIDSVDGTTEYTYDALGQLLTETNGTGVVNTMTYDNYGNIKTKNGVAYTYGNGIWKDLLTKVGSATISYDAQGNPTSYLGHTLTWEKGRQLKSYDGNTYTYNANGIRTSKTVGGVKHEYTLDGTKILREAWGNNVLIPFYDNEDSVCGISYNYTPYYFIKNQQGDVIAITNANAEVVARYSYDAWGKVLSVTDGVGNNVANIASHIANINPYRYRGYYYDEEIDLYYLQSRYYDAEIGRFINGDEASLMNCFGTPVSYNLFVYCENGSVNKTDPHGFKATKLYSGIVGFGIQILLSVNLLCYQGFVGVEGLWFAFTKNNNFGNGIIPWCYWFAGGNAGFTLDFDLLLSKKFLDNPKNVLNGFGMGFSVSVSITFFLIHAKGLEGPKDYTREFKFTSITAWGITGSKAWSSNISTYGIGFSWEVGASPKEGISIGKNWFGIAAGVSYYWAVPINPNAKELYSLVESKV